MTDALQPPTDLVYLARQIKDWASELGFQQAGITGVDLADDDKRLQNWLAKHYQGDMDWLARHGSKRSHPDELVPGTLRVISVRMDYMPPNGAKPQHILKQANIGYVSRYAMGRDYHKLIRKKLQLLAKRINDSIGSFGYRVFTDSAPILEKALARNAGLGWIGKHTNLINKKAGSWFFLGEIYTDLPLPTDTNNNKDHCGSCTACIEICPTQAIIGPRELDARRCISYLTIELKGSIPEEFRPLISNRIYGCDDCQLICPWNKFSQPTGENDFQPRHGLDAPELVELFSWTEEQFLSRMEGSAIRRIGYQSWLRNIAVAMGNAPASTRITNTLNQRQHDQNDIVREHVNWALHQQATTENY